jgi:hypothetical protein
VESQTVAGEPVDALVRGLRKFTCRKTDAGTIAVSARLGRELGGSIYRALIRIEQELYDADRASRHGVHSRTPEQRRADALVALVLRVADAKDAT